MRRIQATFTDETTAKGTACHLISFGASFEFRRAEAVMEIPTHYIIDVPADYASMLPIHNGTSVVIDDSDPSEMVLRAVSMTARLAYAADSDDIEIDDVPRFSVGEGGIWVSGWMWVETEDEEEEDVEFCAVSCCFQEPQEGTSLCIAHTGGNYCEHGNHVEDRKCSDCAEEVDECAQAEQEKLTDSEARP